MIKEILKYTLLFVLCLLLQVLVFDKIYLSGYVNIYFYVLFILLLPIEISPLLTMFLAFFLGISVDMFSNTLGMHASALVFMAYLRPSVLRFLSPYDGYEPGMQARANSLGVGWFIRYSMVLIFAHHFLLLFIEAFNFSLFFFTLLKVMISTLATGFIVFISQYLVFRK